MIKRGEEAEGMYLIIDGQVNVYYKTTEATLKFLDVADDIGDFCLLDKRSHFSYCCKSDVLCMFIPVKKLREILEKSYQDKFFMFRRAKLRSRQLIILKEKHLKLKESLMAKLQEGTITMSELCLIRSTHLANVNLTPEVRTDYEGLQEVGHRISQGKCY